MSDIVRNVSRIIDDVSSTPEMVTVTLNGLNNTQFEDCAYILTTMFGENNFNDISELDTEDIIEQGSKTINFLVKKKCLKENIKCVILGLYDADSMEEDCSVKILIKKGTTISRDHMQRFAMTSHSRLGALSTYSDLPLSVMYQHLAPHVYYNRANTRDITTSDPAILYTILDTLYILEEKIIDEGLILTDTDVSVPLYFIIPYALKEEMFRVMLTFLDSVYTTIEVNNTMINDYLSVILFNSRNEPCHISIIFNKIVGDLMEIIVTGVIFGNRQHTRFTKPSIFIYFLQSLMKNYMFFER